MVTHSFLSLIPRISAKTEHVIVGEACTTKRPVQDFHLIVCWVKTESVGTFYIHNSHFTILICELSISANGMKKTVSLPHRPEQRGLRETL